MDFLCSGWLPRGRKQKSGKVKATPGIGTHHFYRILLVEALKGPAQIQESGEMPPSDDRVTSRCRRTCELGDIVVANFGKQSATLLIFFLL